MNRKHGSSRDGKYYWDRDEDDASGKIRMIMSVTPCSTASARIALADANGNVDAAVLALIAGEAQKEASSDFSVKTAPAAPLDRKPPAKPKSHVTQRNSGSQQQHSPSVKRYEGKSYETTSMGNGRQGDALSSAGESVSHSGIGQFHFVDGKARQKPSQKSPGGGYSSKSPRGRDDVRQSPYGSLMNSVATMEAKEGRPPLARNHQIQSDTRIRPERQTDTNNRSKSLQDMGMSSRSLGVHEVARQRRGPLQHNGKSTMSLDVARRPTRKSPSHLPSSRQDMRGDHYSNLYNTDTTPVPGYYPDRTRRDERQAKHVHFGQVALGVPADSSERIDSRSPQYSNASRTTQPRSPKPATASSRGRGSAGTAHFVADRSREHNYKRPSPASTKPQMKTFHEIQVIDCPICFSSQPPSNTITLGNCGHSFCLGCFKKCIQAQIDRGNAASLTCPLPSNNCGKSVRPQELRMALGLHEYEKLEELALKSALAKDPNMRQCPTPDCDYVVFWDGQGQSFCECPKCSNTWCLKCGAAPYHIGKTCEQYKEYTRLYEKLQRDNKLPGPPNVQSHAQAEELTQRYLRQSGVRICKRCGASVSKEEGCNKMKCRCGYRFCYNCGSENAQCRCTPATHGFHDNVQGGVDFAGLYQKDSYT